MRRLEQQIHQAVVSHLTKRAENEIWKPVLQWEGVYMVSNMGRVMRVSRGKSPWRILKPLVRTTGRERYHRVQLSKDNIYSTVKIHRLVLEAFDPAFTPLVHTDHINGDVSDNRLANLRCVTNGQNAKNRGVYRTNKLGVKGVSLKRGKYEAQIQVDGRKIWLGAFDTIEEAAAAYKDASAKHHGEFARSA